MPIFDDPGKNLRAMQEELLSEEFQEPDDGYQPPDYSRTLYEGEECEEPEPQPTKKPRKKSTFKLLFLAALELGAIYLLLRWWLTWL